MWSIVIAEFPEGTTNSWAPKPQELLANLRSASPTLSKTSTLFSQLAAMNPKSLVGIFLCVLLFAPTAHSCCVVFGALRPAGQKTMSGLIDIIGESSTCAAYGEAIGGPDGSQIDFLCTTGSTAVFDTSTLVVTLDAPGAQYNFIAEYTLVNGTDCWLGCDDCEGTEYCHYKCP